MRSASSSDVEPSSDEQPPAWTSASFLELRAEFLADRTEFKALEILKRMVAIDVKQVDANAWLECKDLMSMLLNAIPVQALLETQQIMLLTALESCPSHVVTALAAHLTAHQDVVSPLLNSVAQAVAVAFARRINDPDTFEQLAALLAPVSSNPQLLQELQHQLATTKSSEHRFKVYQVLLCAMQRGYYTPALAPMLQSLVKELSSEDILVVLAAMDALSDAAIASNESANIVNESGAPQKVYELLQSSKEAPDGGFIYPSCVKFFGTLSRVYPDIINSFPSFVPAVIDMVRHFDIVEASQRVLAFDTLAQVAYKAEAKQNLQRLLGDQGVSRVMEAFAASLSSGPIELRARHLEAFATLFQHGDDSLLAQWFSYLGSPMPSVLLSLVQKPFPDLRLASLHAFASLLAHPFGLQTFLGLSGFLDWLLDQSTEHEWEAGRLKADIIRALIASNSSLIDAPLKLRLKAYFVAPKRDPEVEMML
uniref:26S proteasome non-ATPase regulatory subunit 5 n=1 Tax=Haemonchus contortus TaxID=6289 RepID=A0A7I4YAV2_HAECO